MRNESKDAGVDMAEGDQPKVGTTVVVIGMDAKYKHIMYSLMRRRGVETSGELFQQLLDEEMNRAAHGV